MTSRHLCVCKLAAHPVRRFPAQLPRQHTVAGAKPQRSSWLTKTTRRKKPGNSWITLRSNAVQDEDPTSARHNPTSRPNSKAWSISELRERAAYSYFNWRQDTWSDLQLFMLLNIMLVLLGGYIKATVLDSSLAEHGFISIEFWERIYSILVVVLGQELPDEAAGTAQQVFGLIVAAVGLAAFALVLALVEQVVLQVLDDNVRRGSRVFETGHILLACWCENERDMEVIWKMLTQICYAYRSDGGRVVVVLCARQKLDMEVLFRRVLPASARFGTRFVFRQGSPLVPDDLRMVSASSAAATVIVSDSSRPAGEADAEALRSAILLDELDFPGFGVADTRGQIVVEIKSPNTVAMLHYSCSARITALHTGQMNARRMARMVTHPVVAATSNTVWNFTSTSQAYLHTFPHLAGTTFGQLQFYFPDGTIYGVIRKNPRRCVLNPPQSLQLASDDEVIFIRPTGLAWNDFQPLHKPVPVDVGSWTPDMYNAGSVDGADLQPDEYSGGLKGADRAAGLSGRPAAYGAQRPSAPHRSQASFQYMLPLTHYSLSTDEPETVLICGWGEDTFMGDLLEEMDHGPAALASGSRITLFNATVLPEKLQHCLTASHVRRLHVDLVTGDPLDYQDVSTRLDVTQFTTAIVLCDKSWREPELGLEMGSTILARSRRGMLRLESQILLAQLHIRKRLEEQGYPLLNIICEKVAVEGITRFEDRYRLPVGISVNMTSFSAKLLTQALYNPFNILAYAELGASYELTAQSSSAFVGVEERISYWQLMARVQSAEQVLVGYYQLPAHVEMPIDFSINPTGNEWRSEQRVWNSASLNIKLITLAPKQDHSMDSANLQPSRQTASLPPTEAATGLLIQDLR